MFGCFLKILHFLCLRQVWAGVGAGKPIKGQQIQQALLEMGVSASEGQSGVRSTCLVSCHEHGELSQTTAVGGKQQGSQERSPANLGTEPSSGLI